MALTEPLRAGRSGAYRVATHRRDAPADTDGDGIDDLAELARARKAFRAPLNPGTVTALSGDETARPDAGALAIPDLATFQAISQDGWINAGEYDLEYVEHLNFILDTPGEQVYFANQNQLSLHLQLARWAGVGRSYHTFATAANPPSELAFYPHMKSPAGTAGTFVWGSYDSYDLADVARFHALIAANMPFLDNNLVYVKKHLNKSSSAWFRKDKAKFEASRVPAMPAEDLIGNLVFAALNPAVGFGLLRVLGPGDRPTFRDVAVLRVLPNSMPPVAGVISLMPQTPLSHVNLRAVQDGVPNAWIDSALEDETIAPLLGRYVRFEVKAGETPSGGNPDLSDPRLRATYTIREATETEVAAHHAARRPALAQVPSRDLTVTTYKDLDDIAFADADAFGVKAANIAAMRDFGFAEGTVPDGYALPLYFYDTFMTHNGFYDDVDALLADADFVADIATRDAELKKLRRRIRNGAVPDLMATELAALQALFPEGTSIRCRSSTNSEDLPGFSGAGLYDSYTHHPTEGHLSKSVKQVFASLWNLRAFEERTFHRVDHKAAAMGVLLHPNYSDERVNGVAVSDDPFHGSEDSFYVNAQVGEDLVTNPSPAAMPEELLLGNGEEFSTTLLRRSSLVDDGERVLSETHVATLQAALRTIHSRFRTLYAVADDAEFAMEIEFKVTAADAFAVKQARPWVY